MFHTDNFPLELAEEFYISAADDKCKKCRIRWFAEIQFCDIACCTFVGFFADLECKGISGKSGNFVGFYFCLIFEYIK